MSKVQCSFCKQTYRGGINRFKKHLAGVYNRGATPCDKVPNHVRDEIIKFLRNKKELKKGRKLEQVNINDEDSAYGTSAHKNQLNSSMSSN